MPLARTFKPHTGTGPSISFTPDVNAHFGHEYSYFFNNGNPASRTSSGLGPPPTTPGASAALLQTGSEFNAGGGAVGGSSSANVPMLRRPDLDFIRGDGQAPSSFPGTSSFLPVVSTLSLPLELSENSPRGTEGAMSGSESGLGDPLSFGSFPGLPSDEQKRAAAFLSELDSW